MIDVTEGFTSIKVAANGFPHFGAEPRNSTGARVTVEFFRRAPLPPNTDIRVHYDIAENGGLREILGIPKLTHTRDHARDGASYHYRLSHWIPALSVMRFVHS